jgi:hypothetical protein
MLGAREVWVGLGADCGVGVRADDGTGDGTWGETSEGAPTKHIKEERGNSNFRGRNKLVNIPTHRYLFLRRVVIRCISLSL